MSFFKGIGKFIKKNINIKTAIKGVGKLESLAGGPGIISGLQDAHYAKKQANEEARQIALENASAGAGRIIGSNAGQFLSKTVDKAYRQAGTEVQTALGRVGAQVADQSIKEWFKLKWKMLVGILAGIIVVVTAYKFFTKPKSKYGRKW